eukprot:364670-Chlamydomonas_euryale.AAC.1
MEAKRSVHSVQCTLHSGFVVVSTAPVDTLVGHHEHASDAEDADLVSFHVQRGDIIVMGTDGLLDNLTDEEICEELEVQCAMGGSPTQMTHALVKVGRGACRGGAGGEVSDAQHPHTNDARAG